MARWYAPPLNPEHALLGNNLRAARTCWGWSKKHGAWLRLHWTDDTQHHLVVELHPKDELLPRGTNRREEHERLYICWWDGPKRARDAALDEITPLRHILHVKRPITFTVEVP